jgi:hypothetical protein
MKLKHLRFTAGLVLIQNASAARPSPDFKKEGDIPLKHIVKFALLFSVTSVFCLADSWNGKLVDASCKAKTQASGEKMACSATQATTVFAVELSDGKILSLDAGGNAKAADAIRNSKATDPMVSVTGSADASGKVKVESIKIQE